MRRAVAVVLLIAVAEGVCAEPQVKPYTVSGDLREVSNLKQFGITKSMRAKLLQNLFCVVPADHKQPCFVYENNDYRDIPSFVTVDSMLHLYHLVFGFTLRRLEEDKLYPIACRLTETMLKRSVDTYGKLQDPKLEEAELRNIAFFGVADRLLGRDTPFPAAAKAMVEQELAIIAKHEKFQLGAILPYKLDYTQYIPRGHYTRNQTLKRYFMGMMWYGHMPLTARFKDRDGEVKRCDEVSRQALLMVHDMYAAQVQRLWNDLYEPANFFVGFSDDLRPDEVRKIVLSAYGDQATLAGYADAEEFESFVKGFIGDRQPGIKPKFYDIAGSLLPHVDPNTPQLRFMGQRHVPDSEITQRLVGATNLEIGDARFMPKGLDVMAVMGSPRAVRLLDVFYKEPQQWSDYLPNRRKLIAEFADLPDSQWTANMYWGWLDVLRSMTKPYGEGYPSFMLNNGWQDKSLSSALASWAQLRHDTILYVKQSFMAAECGGGQPPPEVKGYVEPVPETFSRLIKLVQLTKELLAPRGLMTEEMATKVDEFEDLLEFLRRCAVKELENEGLTKDENRQLRYIGGKMERLSLWVMSDGKASDWYEIQPVDRDMACIADVHTAVDRRPGGLGEVCLEEGVGHADEIYVIVPIEGKLYLTRGAVFSYYEFPQKMKDRLTDEKWQKRLEEGKEPAPPEWTKFFKSEAPDEGHETVVAKPRSSGC